MRGKVAGIAALIAIFGITPAYAGKRNPPDTFGQLTRGSPPPMRGKDIITKQAIWCSRITPAYAGKSVEIRSSRPALRDHPRLCGEKQAKHGKKIINPGSPPPMRGKVPVNTPLMFSQRITPAYAGKRGYKSNEKFAS